MGATSPRSDLRRSRLRNFVVVVSAFVLGGLVLPNIQISWREPVSDAQEPGLDIKAAPSQPLGPEEFYARAAQAAYKAVVNIDTKQRLHENSFGDWFIGSPQYSLTEGSGVIISKTGYILTNEHVVGPVNEDGKTILVTLPDGRKSRGKVIGADKITDVALVKIPDHIDNRDLPIAQLGSVQGLVPGQMCLAIGNPLKLHFTVTHGVISALKRPVATQDGRVYADLIQHDADINPGNSGGPLVNMQGQVIGINTLVRSQAEGIGFAIPIDTALRVADTLKRYGRIKRPWLGVEVLTNTQELARANDLPDIAGVVISNISPDSPAAAAELQAGDVITRINSQKLHSQEEFEGFQSHLSIGQQVSMEVHRGGQYAVIKIPVVVSP